MQKVGLYALLAIVLFTVVFIMIPTGDIVEGKTGATLNNVQLTLYPSSDPDAVWRFAAKTVTNDPINNLTALSGLSDGERFIRHKDQAGKRTGKEILDATLATEQLTINGQDDLLTDQAKITLIKYCADVDLSGTPENPVRIEQGFGFVTPVATIDSPIMNMKFKDLRMSFQFQVENSSYTEMLSDLDASVKCVNGKRITQSKAD